MGTRRSGVDVKRRCAFLAKQLSDRGPSGAYARRVATSNYGDAHSTASVSDDGSEDSLSDAEPEPAVAKRPRGRPRKVLAPTVEVDEPYSLPLDADEELERIIDRHIEEHVETTPSSPPPLVLEPTVKVYAPPAIPSAQDVTGTNASEQFPPQPFLTFPLRFESSSSIIRHFVE